MCATIVAHLILMDMAAKTKNQAGRSAGVEAAGHPSSGRFRRIANRGALLKTIKSQIPRTRDWRARLARPNIAGARASAQVFWRCFDSLANETNLEPEIAVVVKQRALLGSSRAFLALRAGERELTASVLLDLWSAACVQEIRRFQEFDFALRSLAEATQRQLETVSRGVDSVLRSLAESTEQQLKAFDAAIYEMVGPMDEAADALQRSIQSQLDDDFIEWRLLYNQVIEQAITHGSGAEPARTALRSLMTRLELSQDDLGRILGVSGETIRRWERGATGIPAERRAAIIATEAGLQRLQDLFRPERLPTVIRRPAELFDGETALDWILRGRIAEVADRYETVLVYQA